MVRYNLHCGQHAAHLVTKALACLLLQAEDAGSTRSQKVTGVQATINSSSTTAQSGSQPMRLVVHAAIIVSSCGSIHTPALLLRSGITVGGNVGANLRLHPATGVVGIFPKSEGQAASGQGAVQMYKVCACL